MSTPTAQRSGAPAAGRRGSVYRGGEGMWSWVAHRITGVLTFFFLFAHVLDTALVRVSPDSYNKVISTYKNPIVNLLEVGLVGAVMFHALNGIRIMLIDFWAKGPRYQRVMLWTVVGLWVVVMIPGVYFMLEHTVRTLFRDRLMTAAADPIADRGFEAPRAPRRRVTGRRSNVEMYSWLFMRLSGIVLVVLVLGHLLIMNILDGGVQRINWGFVAGRWSSPFWQLWDLTMLWLAEVHGANGLRTVINDYTRKDGTRFVLLTLLTVSVVLTLGLGTFVIFTFDPTMIANK